MFLQHHLDIPPDPPKVFLQIDTPFPRSEWITVDVLCFMCAGFSVESVRTINVLSVLQYGLVNHGTMWNFPHL